MKYNLQMHITSNQSLNGSLRQSNARFLHLKILYNHKN